MRSAARSPAPAAARWPGSRSSRPIPGEARGSGFELRCRERPEDNGSGVARLLAHAGYHGPPVRWQTPIGGPSSGRAR